MKSLQLFKILSDETRLSIILLLTAIGDLCVCDIYTALNLSQPKTSRHLAILREAGLLCDSKHGKWVHYCISPSIAPWITNIIEQVSITEQVKVTQLLNKLKNKDTIRACST